METLNDSRDSESCSLTSGELLDELRGLFLRQAPERQESFLETCQMADIREQLRNAIRESGLTHYRISKMSGVAIAAIDRFMSGERDITFETAGRICQALGYEIVRPEPAGESKSPTNTVKKASKKKPSA